MNRYPAWWDTSITVYNRYEDALTHVVTWYKTQLTGNFWQYICDKVNIGETVLETEKIICRIPENDKFLEKYQWVALTNDKMADYFTLGVDDIIVKGAVDDVIDEYTAGRRSSDLIEKYKALQGCMEIKSVSNNTETGRGMPHYKATGL